MSETVPGTLVPWNELSARAAAAGASAGAQEGDSKGAAAGAAAAEPFALAAAESEIVALDAADMARDERIAAAASASSAAIQADAAAVRALVADAAAISAGVSAAAAAAGSILYGTVAAGLAATAEGATFGVQGAGASFADYYRKTGGNAVYVSALPSKNAIEAIPAITTDAPGWAFVLLDALRNISGGLSDDHRTWAIAGLSTTLLTDGTVSLQADAGGRLDLLPGQNIGADLTALSGTVAGLPVKLVSVPGMALVYLYPDGSWDSGLTNDGAWIGVGGSGSLPEVPASVSVVQRCYQRTAASGRQTAPVPVTISVGAAYSTLEVCAVDFDTHQPVTPWMPLGSGAAGSVAATLAVPASAARLGMAVRANGGAPAYSSGWYQVGDVIGLWGQSQINRLMGFGTTPAGVTASAPFLHCLGYGNESPTQTAQWRAWDTALTGLDGSFLVEFHNRLRAVTGVAVGFVGYSWGGATASLFDEPGTDAAATALRAALDLAPDFLALYGFIGGTDATSGTDPAVYSAQMATIHAWLRARYTHDWPHYIQPQWARTSGSDAAVAAIRLAQLELIGSLSNARYPFTGPDIALTDAVHQGDAGNLRVARRMAVAVEALLNPRMRDATGPTLVSARRVGTGSADIDLVFRHNGGTTLVNANGSALPENLRVCAAGSTTALAVSSFAITGPASARLTLASIPADGAQFDVLAGYGVGLQAAALYDDQLVPGDTVGLPLRHTSAPIRTPAL